MALRGEALEAVLALVEAGAGVRAELESQSVEGADPHEHENGEEQCHAPIIGLCASSLYALLT